MRFISQKETESLEDFDKMLLESMDDKPNFVEFPEETLKSLYNGLAASEKAKEYLKSRGIDLQSMTYFSLGYSENMNMVTVPVHSPVGMPIGVVGRSIEGKSFKNSTNLPKSKTLFNIHRAKRMGGAVVIVESSFDAIRVHQSGYPNVVATLGGFISKINIQNLNRNFTKVIIMTDADPAGRELGKTIASSLKNKEILWAHYSNDMLYPHDAKDVGDMTEEEVKTCIENALADYEYRML